MSPWFTGFRLHKAKKEYRCTFPNNFFLILKKTHTYISLICFFHYICIISTASLILNLQFYKLSKITMLLLAESILKLVNRNTFHLKHNGIMKCSFHLRCWNNKSHLTNCMPYWKSFRNLNYMVKYTYYIFYIYKYIFFILFIYIIYLFFYIYIYLLW